MAASGGRCSVCTTGAPSAVASADGGRVEGMIVDDVVPGLAALLAYTLAKAAPAGGLAAARPCPDAR